VVWSLPLTAGSGGPTSISCTASHLLASVRSWHTIVRKALSWPARQIAVNAGEDGSIAVGKILEKDTCGFGFDAQSGEYVNMMSKGIIDPAKVVRAALQGAASVAGLFITTEAMVAELPKKESPAMPGGGGMGGMDY
jgi:chaperonin GroEL